VNARCAHGRPVAVDGTGCATCERDKTRCVVCGGRLRDVLAALGVRTHPGCEPEPRRRDEPDERDPRSVPWYDRT